MTLQFKTSIHCGNCVRSVTHFLSEIKNIQHWDVDTQNPDKILTTTGDHLDYETIIKAVEEAGFDIVLLN